MLRNKIYMNLIVKYTLKILRKLYKKTFSVNDGSTLIYEKDANLVSKIIYEALLDDKPCMISRFGSTELNCLSNYIGIVSHQPRYFSYIKGDAEPWWWEPERIKQMQNWSGFFPANEKEIERFCEMMIHDIPSVDVLGSWLIQEQLFEKELKNSKKIDLELLNPFFSSIPWTRALEGKKVLVVHPFANTNEKQYKKRKLLFKDNLLPEFELITIKAVQSIAGSQTKYANWFQALDYMKDQIDDSDYDICLIACGAYGFPLAAHVKKMGKKGFQLGGSLQLLFGIRGKRWENENYNDQYNYAKLMNEHWVRPSVDDKPTGANEVEDACYW